MIIDEAHDLVDRVTSVATGELTAARWHAAARRCGKLIDADVADRLLEAGDGACGAIAGRPCPRAGWTSCRGRSRRDPAARPRRRARRASPRWARSRKEDVGGRDGPQAGAVAARRGARHRGPAARGVRGDDQADQRDVVWLLRRQVSSNPRPPALKRGAARRRRPAARARCSTSTRRSSTSATLTLGGIVRHHGAPMGLPAGRGLRRAGAGRRDGEGRRGRRPPARSWTGLDVGSPFDYTAQRHPLPGQAPAAAGPRRPRRRPTLDELAELIEAAGGRTLGLFSSMRAAKQATEEMRERLDFPILCQGEDSTSLLVQKFSEDVRHVPVRHALACGRAWTCRGRRCSSWSIDRIPFPRPDDPVSSARQRRGCEARGGNGFLTVAGHPRGAAAGPGHRPAATRSVTDRGVVAVLDSRLANARYGGFLPCFTAPVLADDKKKKKNKRTRRWCAKRCAGWTQPRLRDAVHSTDRYGEAPVPIRQKQAAPHGDVTAATEVMRP